jgi:hypothetical protein
MRGQNCIRTPGTSFSSWEFPLPYDFGFVTLVPRNAQVARILIVYEFRLRFYTSQTASLARIALNLKKAVLNDLRLRAGNHMNWLVICSIILIFGQGCCSSFWFFRFRNSS